MGITPFTTFLLRAHGGCDRSVEDAYSSMAPDPAFAFGPCCPTLDFVYMFWDYDYVKHIVYFVNLYNDNRQQQGKKPTNNSSNGNKG